MNVVEQMLKIFEAPANLVDKRVYYLGDVPISLLDWVNEFSMAITGKPARIVPRPLFKALATMGTTLNMIGVRFPITLSRYRSMTEDYFSPIESTIANFGSPRYSLETGVKQTVEWLNLYWNGHFS
jgi:hypothetical protein